MENIFKFKTNVNTIHEITSFQNVKRKFGAFLPHCFTSKFHRERVKNPIRFETVTIKGLESGWILISIGGTKSSLTR